MPTSHAPDITEPFGLDVGVPLTPPISVPPVAPSGMKWDCKIGGLPFLFANSDQWPYRRETGEFRRQRVDTERNPGEQSLDSGYWIRSQASWHYGTGLSSAEPLEVSEQEAQFRFHAAGGVDPWTAGQLSLLHDTEAVYADSGSSQFLIGVDSGILHASASTVTYVSNGGSSAAVTYGGAASATITSLASDGENYYVADQDSIYSGALPSASGAAIWDTGDSTVVRWVKSRLFGSVGNKLYELVGTGPTLPTELYEHPLTGWTWSDFAEGPTAIYAAGYSGDTSLIYKIDAVASASTVTLSQPVVVAELPRGELVKSLYAYLGTFLVIGTTYGTRVASIDTSYYSGGSLTMGPIVVRSSDGCEDAVAVDGFVYVTVGGKGEVGDRTQRGGLWRIDLSTPLNNQPLQFAAAPDVVVPDGVTGDVTQVTVAGGRIYLCAQGDGVYRVADEYVPEGWLETGRVRLGTLEAKAWRDIRVTGEPNMDGLVTAYASLSDASAPSLWTQAAQVNGTNYDVQGTLTQVAPNRQGALFLAFKLSTDDTDVTPVFTGYQVRAVPAPQRSELISVPLMVFDAEADRNNQWYGYVGSNLSWIRWSQLKQLERAASTVQWEDFTTGERAEAYIERVSLARTTPPSKSFKGSGGVATVLLRLV